MNDLLMSSHNLLGNTLEVRSAIREMMRCKCHSSPLFFIYPHVRLLFGTLGRRTLDKINSHRNTCVGLIHTLPLVLGKAVRLEGADGKVRTKMKEHTERRQGEAQIELHIALWSIVTVPGLFCVERKRCVHQWGGTT